MKLGIRRTIMTLAGVAMLSASLISMTGCGAFFQCEGKTSCGTTSTATGTGDYVYVSNSASGSQYISAYTIGTNSLTAVSGSPFPVSFVPIALKVSPNNNFLYAAAESTTSPGIYVFTISSAGALGGVKEYAAGQLISSMDISPDGNWLFTLDGTGTVLTGYELNTSTGAVGSSTTLTALGGPSASECGLSVAQPATQSCSVAVSPAGDYVAVSLGSTVGATSTEIFPYSSSAGATPATGQIAPASSTSGDFSVAFDDSGYLYIARTAELASYGSLNSATPTAETPYTNFATGAAPRSVVLSTNYNYIFTANEGVSTISMFNVSSGVVSLLNGTNNPISGPASASALGVDRSGDYLLAAGYNQTNGLQMFTISSTGLASVSAAAAGTGTDTTVPVVMALTHP